MLLIVDNNEKSASPKVFKQLQKYFSNVIAANVVCGDINIPLDDGTLLAIERKTPADFLSSIADGRIFAQVESMAQHAKYSAVIITGKISYSEDGETVYADGEITNWRGSSVRAVFSVIQFSGCALLWCPPNRYPEIIAELYTTVNKSDIRQSIKKRRIITFPPVDSRVEQLAQFPGIGLKLAQTALRFVKKMENQSSDDEYGQLGQAFHWLSILSGIAKSERPIGWGPNKILAFRKALGLAPDEYIAVMRESDDGEK